MQKQLRVAVSLAAIILLLNALGGRSDEFVGNQISVDKVDNTNNFFNSINVLDNASKEAIRTIYPLGLYQPMKHR